MSKIILDNFIMHYKNASYPKVKEIESKRMWTLGPLSLEISEGERVGIVGRSGSGKTSLLRVLQHYPHIIRKNISYEGVYKKPQEVMITVMQEPKAVLNSMRSVRQSFKVLHHSMFFSRHRSPLSDKEILHYLHMVGLSSDTTLLNSRVHQLSGGMAQRVMIALGLALHPHWILADELSASLDEVNERQIMDILVARHPSFLLVSHRVYLLERYCSRIIFLDEGKILYDGAKDTFFDDTKRKEKPYVVQDFLNNVLLGEEK